eukprot:Gregarina_sp_Poly_1__3527@NODE_202_length_11519_cov_188_798463_g180_i0_p5_GENE_NODE_202_length_11519_cov_188_798463_g180_i0NODE_202_length_11519_cov_188_798463_g180_i0_p5_ORF_typecomplete_len372_score44_11DnaJ/PF00226_31/0_021_NODE_202_length_11519_cov_188_798463_g180_i059217036
MAASWVNALVTRAKDRLDDLLDSSGAKSPVTLATVLAAATADSPCLPLFYSTPVDRHNVALLSTATAPTLAEALSSLPALHLQPDTCAVSAALWYDECGSLVFIPWPSEIWALQPLPLVTDTSRGLQRTVHFKVIYFPHGNCVDRDILRRTHMLMQETPLRYAPQVQTLPDHDSLATTNKTSILKQSPIATKHSPTAMKLSKATYSTEAVDADGSLTPPSQLNPSILIDSHGDGSSNTSRHSDDLLMTSNEEGDISAERLSTQQVWLSSCTLTEVDDELREALDNWSLTSDGQIKDIRVLLTTMQTVTPAELDWQPPSLGELMSNASSTRQLYRRAILIVHPDKVPGDNVRLKYTADRIFTALHKSYTSKH